MNNITRTQREYLDRLMQRDAGTKVRWHDGRGTASVLRGNLVSPDRIGDDVERNAEQILATFLKDFGPLVAPEDSEAALRLVKTHKGKGKSARIRAMQLADGIPIHGATLLLFADPETGVHRVQSGCFREVKVPALSYRGRPIDLGAREKSLRQRLTRDLRATDEGERFLKRKLEEGFGEDDIARDNFPLTSPPTH